jgi:hypothetical protein
MSLYNYSWSEEEPSGSNYEGKYVTHDFWFKHEVENIVEGRQINGEESDLHSGENDLEKGEFSVDYKGKKMDLRFDIFDGYAIFYTDEAFEEEFEDEEFSDVIGYLMTPKEHRRVLDLHPE